MAWKRKKGAPFIGFAKEMFDSKVYWALSNPAKLTFQELKASWDYYKPGLMTAAYSTLRKKYRFGPGTASRVFKELLQAGIIEVHEHGGLFRRPTIYKLKGFSLTDPEKANQFQVRWWHPQPDLDSFPIPLATSTKSTAGVANGKN